MKIEINKNEVEVLKSLLKFHLRDGLDEEDYDQFVLMAGEVMTCKEFIEECEMVKSLIKRLRNLK